MIRRKRATVLGVSLLAALGLMSVSAAGAQAGQWTIDGKTMSELKLGSEQFELEGGPISINGAAGIECEEQEGWGQVLSGGISQVSLLLSGCKVREGEESCQVPYGEIELQAKATLSNDGTYALFSPSSGGAFGSITLEDAEYECALIEGGSGSETASVHGGFAAELGSAAVGLSLYFSQEINSAALGMGNGLWIPAYWGMDASLDGTASMRLSGPNAGKVLGTSS